MSVTVRRRMGRQNLQRFAAGGGVGLYGSKLPTPAPAQSTPSAISPGGGNYVTPTTGIPASPVTPSYAPYAASEPAINATAQGMPSATPSLGYTPGPQTNQYGSWGAAADANTTGAGAIPGDPAQAFGNSTNYQRASTGGNYGAYSDNGQAGGKATHTAPVPSGALAGVSGGPANSGYNMGWGAYYTGAGNTIGPESPSTPGRATQQGSAAEWKNQNVAKGGAIAMKFDTGGAVPDPGGAIPDDPNDTSDVDPTTTGDTGQAGDPRQAVMQALTTSRQMNGLNDAVFGDLSNAIHQSSGGQQQAYMPSRPAGPGGDTPTQNPFPTRTPAIPFGTKTSNNSGQPNGQQMAMNTSGMRPSTNVEDDRDVSGGVDQNAMPVMKSNDNSGRPPVNSAAPGPSVWPYNTPQGPLIDQSTVSGSKGGAIPEETDDE
jgi:hypothetical protein